MYHDEIHKMQTRLKQADAGSTAIQPGCVRLMSLLGTGSTIYADAITRAADEIERLREALGLILTIGSLEKNGPLDEAKHWARKALGKNGR